MKTAYIRKADKQKIKAMRLDLDHLEDQLQKHHIPYAYQYTWGEPKRYKIAGIGVTSDVTCPLYLVFPKDGKNNYEIMSGVNFNKLYSFIPNSQYELTPTEDIQEDFSPHWYCHIFSRSSDSDVVYSKFISRNTTERDLKDEQIVYCKDSLCGSIFIRAICTWDIARYNCHAHKVFYLKDQVVGFRLVYENGEYYAYTKEEFERLFEKV
jgi:hypothetical protein